jgi:hypothetical protein
MSSVTASPTSTSCGHASDDAAPRRKGRVSAEHTLNRVRENQRRHRARQRDRVATLEEKLAQTEHLLAEARAEITFLKAQQEATNVICRDNHLELPEDLASTVAAASRETADLHTKQPELEVNGGPPFPYLGTSTTPDLSFLGSDISPAFIIDINSLELPLSPPVDDPLSGPPPCCSDTVALQSLLNEPVDPECSTCKTKPLPDPSESTTLCAQAFVLISQQNFRNLDPETIRMWLAQGLRRAQREGEGCRVENGALLRLLDYISGI